MQDKTVVLLKPGTKRKSVNQSTKSSQIEIHFEHTDLMKCLYIFENL